MKKPIAKWYAVFRSISAFEQVFVSIHPSLDAAENRVDLELQSHRKFSKLAPMTTDEITYIVIEVPIVYVAQWKRGE